MTMQKTQHAKLHGKMSKDDLVALKPKEACFVDEGAEAHLSLNPVSSQKALRRYAGSSLMISDTQGSTVGHTNYFLDQSQKAYNKGGKNNPSSRVDANTSQAYSAIPEHRRNLS